MVVRKVKKVGKYRAHTTHGGGHRKKRRGAGSRGGRGRAGSGKRAGHKRQGIVLGRSGFRPRRMVIPHNPVNISYFTQNILDILVEQKIVTKEADLYVVNLASLGFTKLLGCGNITTKVKFSVESFSPLATTKVKEVGGEIVKLPKKPVPVPKNKDNKDKKETKSDENKEATSKDSSPN
jgi:large subunit ribosomal protein L15